jgi:integrase/recombinase XerD
MRCVMAPPRFLFISNRRTPGGLGFIACRVTVDKTDKEFATGLRCLREDWDAKAQQIRGRSREVKLANDKLLQLRSDLNALGLEKDNARIPYTAESLVREWQGKGTAKVTLLQSWSLFIVKREPLIGLSLSKAKIDADKVRHTHLAKFLKQQHLTGLLPDAFTPNLADDFILYLRTTCELSQNYTNKVIQTVKQVLRWGIRHKHATRNPLDGYTLKFAPVKPALYLSTEELKRLRDFTFSSAPLRQAADCFLFQCYTALAYVDLARFRRSQHTRLGPDGKPWLYMDRQKTQHSTGQSATVPLLPVALEILQQYGERLPVPTNQVYNRYLKEIAAVLGFENLGLTSHVGRKTAGAQFLLAGISLEAVSKIMGHSNVLMTQKHYVQITSQVVARDFARVYGRNEEPA